MDPDNRILLQVNSTTPHADQTFSILMGEDAEERRRFIQRNAKDVRFPRRLIRARPASPSRA